MFTVIASDVKNNPRVVKYIHFTKYVCNQGWTNVVGRSPKAAKISMATGDGYWKH